MFTTHHRRLLCAGSAAAALAALGAAPASAIKATDPQDVRIVNEATEPVPVVVQNQPPAAPAEEHVQTFTTMTVPGGETILTQVLLEVPAGKRFVAKQLSGEVGTLQEGSVRAQVSAQNLGEARSFTFSLPLTPGLGNDVESVKRGQFNEEMHFEVRGPGEVVGAIARFGPKPENDFSTGWALVGTLIDCPSCQASAG